ncbi:hypothetical protein Vadar_033990 [Vaccinium darrowii]|uniref:Uncharacterized protein n=1 Tax=Vaccinium darrowii TaxID=229202 RepID=A0ACB7Z0H9_9ERIC|nr:hypothetical protein Vadar_033990 [Vaccinium darrowii]
MSPSFDWWGNSKDAHHIGTPVVVKMENPNNWSMVELEGPLDDEDDFLLNSADGPMQGRRPEKPATRTPNCSLGSSS